MGSGSAGEKDAVRLRLEQLERQFLSKGAVLAAQSRGRERPEPESEARTCFMRDRDRIIHSKAFRRLKHKTQVFLSPEGDHYRTRLTHTLEVSQISRTVARGLGLNEDLTEAIALGHDLGHAAFGHAGERALNSVHPGGFAHNEQSLRVVDRLEAGGAGLNLTWEVRDGILNHTGTGQAATLEGRIVRYADRIAYINHDIDDAIRAEILSKKDLPAGVIAVLGDSHSRRINTLVCAMIAFGLEHQQIGLDEETEGAMLELRAFMFDKVYLNPNAKGEEHKGEDILCQLYRHFSEHADDLPADYMQIAMNEGAERAACDYVAGMTDRFAVDTFVHLYVPQGWSKV